MRLRIVSPAGLVSEGEADGVTLPTAAGEITILPGHADYVGILAEGSIRPIGGKLTSEFNVTGGAVTCNVDLVTILVD